jgi:hypothetical protein
MSEVCFDARYVTVCSHKVEKIIYTENISFDIIIVNIYEFYHAIYMYRVHNSIHLNVSRTISHYNEIMMMMFKVMITQCANESMHALLAGNSAGK